jgi:hypothetical protein
MILFKFAAGFSRALLLTIASVQSLVREDLLIEVEVTVMIDQ